jgi:hypothetical protein
MGTALKRLFEVCELNNPRGPVCKNFELTKSELAHKDHKP